MKVIVDADACPRTCLALLQKHKYRWGYELLTVSCSDHQIANSNHVVVGKGKDAADFAVINRTVAGDLVVTQDWGLAALALAKNAFALSFSGRIYTDGMIEFLLEERSLKARYRRFGGRTKGASPRTGQDDLRFEKSLLQLLERAQKA